MKISLRTDETQAEYDAYKKTGGLEKTCNLCAKEPIQEFKHWSLLQNSFPYDKIAKKHHILSTRLHCMETELTVEAQAELVEIKNTFLDDKYNYILEALPNTRTIPKHFHLHVIEFLDA